MRFSLLTLIIITSSNLFGQDLVNPFYRDTITAMTEKCQEEILKANDDFTNNSFVIELIKPIPFSDTQQKLLLDRYRIQSVYRNGLISPNYDCYNFHLKTLVKQRFGLDILKYTKRSADSLDKIGLGDWPVSFKKSDGELVSFLKANLSSKTKREIKSIKDVKVLFLKIDVSEYGYAINATIDNTLNQGQLEIEILKILKDEALWLPETDDGKGIASSLIYSINIEDF